MLEEDKLRQGLHNSELFKGLDAAVVEQAVDAAQWQIVEQGHYVYRQGENNRRFYIVAGGEVELTMNVADDGQLIVSHIGPGGHFGETSLLTNRPNCINARALSRLTLVFFDADAFHTLLQTNHAIEHQLTLALANRLRVSFHDHADSLNKMQLSPKGAEHNLDATFFADLRSSVLPEKVSLNKDVKIRLPESTILRQIMKAVSQFAGNLEPILITGEAGTGRRMVAQEIHRASACKNGPYTEIDIRSIDPEQLEGELFGCKRDAFAFSQIEQLGVFERLHGGTVVLYNAQHVEPDVQRQLVALIRKLSLARTDNDSDLLLHSRIIFICTDTPHRQDGHNRLLPTLYALVAKQHFQAAPLRMHRRDIPRLVQYYLKRYSRQYGKTINQVDELTLGMFMNYDWPGNLTEMTSVIQRAVILGKNHEPLNDRVLLGIPKSEGKWEFNLLRLPAIRALLTSRFFPGLPRVIVGVFLALILSALFFGPVTAEKNIGLTLSWVVGWPLLIFSFFFLARTWCSVCGLSVPGWLVQHLVKPERATPQFVKQYSGWIMAVLCIFLFWLEITWDAYHSPRLTAWIISSITLAALFFSVLYKRRVWCRYLCPLGALNALFSMPSILELRSNTHMCMNRCIDHLCYTGEGGMAGCPMFRHPFLVDNNRDCILCMQCVKNCKLNSVHLNLRLAPQELWNQQSPRLADSFLVVSLAAIFFPFTINQNYPGVIDNWAGALYSFGLPHSPPLAASMLFFSVIAIYLFGYAVLSQIMARLTGNSWQVTASTLGYGMIPLVLGAFMAAHLEIFVGGLWLLADNVQDLIGLGGEYTHRRVMSRDATFILQFITVTGSLLASLYATRRIISRLLMARPSWKVYALPAFLLCLSAVAYLWLG
jgi:CRP-like cAMP-binding protein/polyferredoxin